MEQLDSGTSFDLGSKGGRPELKSDQSVLLPGSHEACTFNLFFGCHLKKCFALREKDEALVEHIFVQVKCVDK